jgi:hypothetical protein
MRIAVAHSTAPIADTPIAARGSAMDVTTRPRTKPRPRKPALIDSTERHHPRLVVVRHALLKGLTTET